jgi:Na+/melibiose symporter-like transporter
MNIPSVAQMLPVLQTAIGPMILISGLGLVLLTMTNRLGRTIDRVRILTAVLPAATESKRAKVSAQLRILWRRARLIRMAIMLCAMSALASAILIIVIFFTALWQLEVALLVGALFILSMLCLIGALSFVILDINQSLMALKLEMVADEE